jgi:hypothetical protein
MRRILKLLPWPLLIVAVSGASECEHTEYTLRLSPVEGGLRRSLTCQRKGGEQPVLAPEEQARIAALYPDGEHSQAEGAHKFVRVFADSMPADIGGAGRLAIFASPLGRAFSYQERFRGHDDLGVSLQLRLAAADRLADLLIGWAGWMLAEQPGFDRLERFLDERLRADFKDLLVYAATALVLEDYAPGSGEEIAARVGQLLYERGYFSLDELADLAVAFARDERVQPEQRTHSMDLLRRRVLREMGHTVEELSPEALDFLATPDKAYKSLLAYLTTTPPFRQRASKPTIPGPPPNPQDLLDQHIEALLPMKLFETPDLLSIELACPVAPWATNGGWDPTGKAVRWKQAPIRSRPRLPSFAYAHWSEPNDEFQKARFGKIAVAGQALAEINLWRAGLRPVEATEWDAFVAGLDPRADLPKALAGFRFSGEPADGKSLAEFAVGRILAGLTDAQAGVSSPEAGPHSK